LSNSHHGNGANGNRTKRRRNRYHENIKRRAQRGDEKAQSILKGMKVDGTPLRSKAGKGSYFIPPPRRKHWTQTRAS